MPSPLAVARPILLVGMMGSGKTTLGRRVAERLALPFADSDAMIEADLGMDVAEIFRTRGEASFRHRERTLVNILLKGSPSVIASGGGAFTSPAVREASARHALSIWLDAPVDVLAARVSSTGARPLLKGDPKAVLADLLEIRRTAYAKADLRVPIGWESPDETVEAILGAIGQAS